MPASWTGCSAPAATKDGQLLFQGRGTSVEATSISDAIPVPVRGRILRFDFAKVSGDAATYQPRISRIPTAPDAPSIDLVAKPAGDPATSFSVAVPIPYYAPDGRLYVHAVAASGVNNEVKFELLIAPGWE